MREVLDSEGGSHDNWIQRILSCYSKVKVKVLRIKFNKSHLGDPLLAKQSSIRFLYFENYIIDRTLEQLKPELSTAKPELGTAQPQLVL